MIRGIFSLVLILVFFGANAQQGCPTPFGVQNELKRYHVAGGVGMTRLYGDIAQPSTLGRAFFIKGDYQIKRGLYAGIEGQYGSLEATPSILDRREITNNYLAGGINITFHPFEFFIARNASSQSLTHVIMDAFYVGVGVLGIINNYKLVRRDKNYGEVGYVGPVPPENYGPVESYNDKGIPVFKKKINSYTRPSVNVGLAVPINRRYSKSGSYWSALVNVQLNFANNDLLDGYMPYDADFNRIGTKNDMFSMYSLGARYSF
ncbi:MULTISPECIES: hypothetical protein [Sphingobacterium]|uniref:hypothetical protein n=1 Tax=Sphingobacterium TaxID=28453 RepID=UPI0013DD7C09|nr:MULTISPECIES: hypothetical protein [unclassified Sphingobacterium]